MKKYTVYLMSLLALAAIMNSSLHAAAEWENMVAQRIREYKLLLQDVSALSSRYDACRIAIQCNQKIIEFQKDYIDSLKQLRKSEGESFSAEKNPDVQKWIHRLDALRKEMKPLADAILELRKSVFYENALRLVDKYIIPIRGAVNWSESLIQRIYNYRRGAQEEDRRNAEYIKRESIDPLKNKKSELARQLDSCRTRLAPLTEQLRSEEARKASIRPGAANSAEVVLFDTLQQATRMIRYKQALLIEQARLKRELEPKPLLRTRPGQTFGWRE